MPAGLATKVPLKSLKTFAAANVPNPLFVVLSGSHAYGFPSVDSDFDLRGAYIAKTREVLGLRKPPENLEQKEGLVELVVYELEKFLGLLLSPSGYILEQINSPYPIIATPLFKELKRLSKAVVCKALHSHYSGFAMSVYKKARQANWADIKEDLYLLRILMTGITLLETGKVVVNLAELNKAFKFDVVPELIALKMQSETAKGILNLDKESAELFARLDEAYKSSNLPERIEDTDKFDEFLLKARMANLK